MSFCKAWLKHLFIVCVVTAFAPAPLQAVDGLLDPELISLYRGTNVNPFDVTATNNLAMKYLRQGRYGSALKLLKRAQSLAPMRGDIEKNIAQLNLLMSQMSSLNMNMTLSYNRTFKDNEVPFVPAPWGLEAKVDEVISPGPDSVESQEHGSVNPFDSQSLIATAAIKIERGELRAALKDLRRARRLSPWMKELDDKIAVLESHVFELDTDDMENTSDSRFSVKHDEFSGEEPPEIWLD